MAAQPEYEATSGEIRTARLILRRPCMGDAGEIAELADNWNVVRNLALVPYPYMRADAEDWIASLDSAEAERAYAIRRLGGDGEFIGVIGINHTEAPVARGLGYWFGEPYWGQGYATEAARALIADLFGADTDLREIRSECHTNNAASLQVMRKCGFEVTGETRSHSLARASDVRCYTLRLERAGWTGAAAAGNRV